MSIEQFFQSVIDCLHSSASVKTIYGEPIVVDGKTVIPVAKVTYGFGGGEGTKKKRTAEEEEKETEKTGEGGGGGVIASPVGVVEITQKDTRFIPFNDKTKLAGVLIAGLFLGFIMGKRSKK
jgi:uncharacterized spore protein YtfJ